MAEFVMKDLVRKAGLSDRFYIESAATSSEEVWGGRGNPVYPPARAKLREHGIDPGGKRARRTTREDYARFDYLIGMDYANAYNMRHIYGGDPDGKISLLLDHCGRAGWTTAAGPVRRWRIHGTRTILMRPGMMCCRAVRHFSRN